MFKHDWLKIITFNQLKNPPASWVEKIHLVPFLFATGQMFIKKCKNYADFFIRSTKLIFEDSQSTKRNLFWSVFFGAAGMLWKKQVWKKFFLGIFLKKISEKIRFSQTMCFEVPLEDS